jgi:hypothetical protein
VFLLPFLRKFCADGNSLAHTYKFASYLPSVMLDTLLNVPHFLIGLRNRLTIAQPFRQPPADPPQTASASYTPPPEVDPNSASRSSAYSQHSVEPRIDPSEDDETSPNDEDESLSGESSGVGSSWVSLNESRTDIQEDASGV